MLLLALRDQVSAQILGSPQRQRDIYFLAPAVLLATSAATQIGIVTGRHLIGKVAGVNIATALLAAAVGVSLVAAVGIDGLAPAILITSAGQLLFSSLARRSARPLPTQGRGTLLAEARPLLAEARPLLAVGLPVAASQLASTAATIVVPLVMVQVLDQASVGLYRAAVAISFGYLTLFASALIQDFLPRVAAASDPHELTRLIEMRMRLIMGLALPVILALLAIGPWIVEWLYSGEFSASFDVLRWLLLGDLLRLPAWVLTYVLLGRQFGRAYLGVELIAGGVLVIGAIVGMGSIGLEGVGVGYAVAQAVYLAFAWLVVRRRTASTPGRLQAVVLLVAAASAAVLLVDLGETGRLAIFGVGACLLAILGWPRLYRMHASGEI